MSRSDRQTRVCGGEDVRAERNRHTPVVTQLKLAEELRWHQSTIGKVENGEIALQPEEYLKMIEAIRAIVARRADGRAGHSERRNVR